MTSPIRLLFSFLLSLALHRCLLIEIRERRYTPPRTRPNARRIDRCTLVLRIWRPQSSSLWLDGRQTGTYPLHELSDIARPLRSSRSLLAATLTLLSGGFQLAVALTVNLDLSACEHILWRHIADGAVQPDVVIP